MAWLILIYLSDQLISDAFRSADRRHPVHRGGGRIARLPRMGVVVVLFGKPRSASTWRGAGGLRVNMADLFGGPACKAR